MITAERAGRRRRAALVGVMIGTLATSAGVTTKRADAHATGKLPTPVYEVSSSIKTPVLQPKVKVEEKRQPHVGPDPDLDPATSSDPTRRLDEVACTLELCANDVRHLKAILREQSAGDLDLIEDTLYHTELVDEDAVARVALAVRLETALG